MLGRGAGLYLPVEGMRRSVTVPCTAVLAARSCSELQSIWGSTESSLCWVSSHNNLDLLERGFLECSGEVRLA